MTAERKKSTMVSARLPTGLVDRVDYVVRNIESKTVVGRSTALREAAEDWLTRQEDRLRELGILAKKTR